MTARLATGRWLGPSRLWRVGNFVGVVDQDGDQTEGHWKEPLRDSEGEEVTADLYMPGFVRAYTWHAIGHGYLALDGGDAMEIGQGIWVYFGKDALAP